MDVNFGRILLILVKIDDFPVSIWWMGATLHVRAKIFADHWSTCRQRRHRDRPAFGFLEKSVDFPVSVRSGPLGSSYETGSDRSTNRTKNRQKSESLNSIPYGGLQGQEVCITFSFVFFRNNLNKFDRLCWFPVVKFSIFRTH